MEGKAQMPDQALLLLLSGKFPQMVLIVFLIVVIHQCMKQIKVKISCPGPLQTGRKLLLRRLLTARRHGVDLRGQRIGFAGMPLNQRFLCSLLRSLIYKCGIKISKACFQEHIYHLLYLLNVNLFPLFGQTHQAESQLLHLFSKIL